jgi:hypothetical protein
MGFYAAQWCFMYLPDGLATGQICIMQRASWSCLDDTAFLDRDKAWLAKKCGMGFRTLERHLARLGYGKLELLVWGDGGFRLPRFYEFHRQIGGRVRQFDRQNDRQNGGAYKEGFLGIPKERNPPTPLNRERDRERDREPSHLHTFAVARCEICLVHHDWEVREPYADTSVRILACPDWRTKLRAAAEIEK